MRKQLFIFSTALLLLTAGTLSAQTFSAQVKQYFSVKADIVYDSKKIFDSVKGKVGMY